MGSYNVYRQSEFKDQIAKLERELAEAQEKIRELESKDDNGKTASSED
jgi:hypothetical protein